MLDLCVYLWPSFLNPSWNILTIVLFMMELVCLVTCLTHIIGRKYFIHILICTSSTYITSSVLIFLEIVMEMKFRQLILCLNFQSFCFLLSRQVFVFFFWVYFHIRFFQFFFDVSEAKYPTSFTFSACLFSINELLIFYLISYIIIYAFNDIRHLQLLFHSKLLHFFSFYWHTSYL